MNYSKKKYQKEFITYRKIYNYYKEMVIIFTLKYINQIMC